MQVSPLESTTAHALTFRAFPRFAFIIFVLVFTRI
jgi:hypothetical protein